MINIDNIAPHETLHIRQAVLWPSLDLSECALPDDANGVHLGAKFNDQLIGVVSAFSDGRRMQFRKFAVLNEFQNSGIGTLLLTHLLRLAADTGANEVWCDARCDATDFYHRFGFKTVGAEFLKNGVRYIVMSLNTAEV